MDVAMWKTYRSDFGGFGLAAPPQKHLHETYVDVRPPRPPLFDTRPASASVCKGSAVGETTCFCFVEDEPFQELVSVQTLSFAAQALQTVASFFAV